MAGDAWGVWLATVTIVLVFAGTIVGLMLLFWSAERAESAFEATITVMVLITLVRVVGAVAGRRENDPPN
ncbi:hypothetical protein [Couchioplanes caeruleus]|uniref:Uncharacterized protein n=2 Tax=Couchioplanes caeruleus TaxID=56438 RepID=A0A1K0G8S7_9ACTN|nr:hypothetical protein [Couchioplanes caeruleus]OJF13650.1 hypothetical protein BG844_14130 [Couchioplanes caeruleus subsp. caeruleus]ROP31495.1 hypothetical protein EDD30_4407 [Couchioplanes caeruleus]